MLKIKGERKELNKKPLIIVFALLLVTPAFVASVAGLNITKIIPNVKHYINASIGEPEVTDSAWAYDTASSEMIFNVYETLIFWPYEGVPSAVEDFQLMLADEVIIPTGSNPPGLTYPGIIKDPAAPAGTVETWYFKIRPNVPFHDSKYGYVTPGDVEYSIERGMTFDHINGPAWMLYYPLGMGGSVDFDTVESIYRDVDDSGTVSAGDVLLLGLANPDGTALVAFAANEKHAENKVVNGQFDTGEAIYLDADASGTVSAGDTKITGPTQADGTTLVAFAANEKHVEYGAANAVYNGKDGKLDYVEAKEGGPVIDSFVESNSTHVWFNCKISYPPFMQILAQTWASVFPQAWGADLAAEGRFFWPGWTYTGTTGDPYSAWADYNDPTHAQLTAPTDAGYTRMMGTGPYKFNYWKKGDAYQLVKFDNYWRGWPGSGESGSIDTFTLKLVESWPARRAMFLSDLKDKQADMVDVPRAYIGQVETAPGVRGVKNLPTLTCSPSMYFTYQVRSDAIYFTNKPQLGGVDKLDLLGDKHMRKAFAHALDYGTYLVDAFLGEADQPATPIIKGLAQYNATKQKYTYDMAQVQAELQLAWAGAPGGSAWTQGFYVPLTYNTGNEARRIACEMIEASIEGIGGTHGTFSVDVFSLPWGEAFLPAMRRSELSNFFVGWIADYADADNFVVPFLHPVYGTYCNRQQVDYSNFDAGDFAPNSGRVDSAGNYRDWTGTVIGTFPAFDLSNDYVAAIIDAAATGTPEERLAMYSEIEDIAYAAASQVPLAQPLGRQWERDWLQGWYYNPICVGGWGEYPYHLWKGLDADTNGDGVVDVEDSTPINHYYFDAFWVVDHWEFMIGAGGGYNRKADISSEFEVAGKPRTWELDGDEIDQYHYGLIAGNALPGVDGYVNIFDQALINAQLNDKVSPR